MSANEKVFKPESPKEPDFRQPLTIMTEKDAYIAERMKEQPKSFEDLDIKVTEEKDGIHRLSLPDFFEPLSYDCTRGLGCKDHGWVKEEVNYGLDKKMDRWVQMKRGKYVFRWLNKNPRALDQNINVRGWYLVNQSFSEFSKAPKILFSVSGGVQNGDSILAFMPIQKALALREKPSKESQDHVKSLETKHEGHPNFYKAKISPDKDGEDFAPADARQEGRDFKV
jgi:hypothetical protein